MIKKFAANDIADEMFRLLKKTAQDNNQSVISPLDPGQRVRAEDEGSWYVGVDGSTIKVEDPQRGTRLLKKELMSPVDWMGLIEKVKVATINHMNRGASQNNLSDSADDMEAEETREADDGIEEDNLEDFLMREDETTDDASYVDDEIDSMQHHADDELMGSERPASMTASAKDQHLMHGLGKIEASLRRKGEGFAADLVRTTAMSIKQDIVKAASQKTYVLKNLIKMASDLDSRGQKKAAGLVKMTIEKINR